MLEKTYFHLLILVGILSQGSFGTFLGDDIRESSPELLDRKKRVINQVPGEGAPVPISQVPYVVNILQGEENHCVGSILSPRTVITAQICVPLGVSAYRIHSSSIFCYKYGEYHDVIDKKVHGHDPTRASDGIALIFVRQPFVYGRDTGHIELHAEPILPRMIGTVSGWGVNLGNVAGTRFGKKLRSIHVPVIPTRDCLEAYGDLFKVTAADICTYHQEKFCGHSDIGAPLVINNRLAGVLIWRQQVRSVKKPDVFLNLQHADYRQWIISNLA